MSTNQPSLFDALQFDETDLLANQQRQLSTRQKDKLTGKAASAVVIWGILIVGMMGGLTIPTIKDYGNSRASNLLPLILGSAFIALVFAAILILTVTNILKDLKSNEALSISGAVFLTYTSSKSARIQLIIKNKHFTLPDIKSSHPTPSYKQKKKAGVGRKRAQNRLEKGRWR